MDLEYGWYQSAGAVVRCDIEWLCQTAGRIWVGNITNHGPSHRPIGTRKDIGLGVYDCHFAAKHYSPDVYHDGIAGYRAGGQTFRYDKADRRSGNGIEPA